MGFAAEGRLRLASAHPVIPGRRDATKSHAGESGISKRFAEHAGIPRHARWSGGERRVWPGSPQTSFPISIDNIPTLIIFRFVLPHREGRSRSSRLRGGRRWTPEMRRHGMCGVRLSAGRPHRLWSGYHWDRRHGLVADGTGLRIK